MKFMGSIFKTLILSLLIIAQMHFAYAQTASILPPGKTTFFDSNGKPLTSGFVDLYNPGTTTRKTTWQDAAETIPNTNPVVLDAAGRAIIYGDGNYRQVVRDRLNNVIWDVQTSSTGSSGGGSATVGDGDLVGTIKPWGGMIAPNQYAFAYGQELARSSYPLLFSTLTTQQNVNCTIGIATISGLTDTQNISIGASIESTCLSAGATVTAKSISTITASSNAIITTTSTARFFPFGNGDGSTTFNAPDLRGKVVAGRCNMGGVSCSNLTATYFGVNPNGLASGGTESKSTTLLTTNLPPYTPAGTLAMNPHAHNFDAILQQGANDVAGGATTNHNAATGATTSVTVTGTFTGTPAPGQNSTPILTSAIQPTQLLNYIIKTLPDTNPNTFFGVASIGGMQGVITCGSGLTCAGNDISAVVPIFTSTVSGSVPASGGGTLNFLRADGSWSSAAAVPTLNAFGFYFNKNFVNQTGMLTGAYTQVTWSASTFNTTGMPLTSNKWTAPYSGLIQMDVSLFWVANAASCCTPNFVVKIIKNSPGTCNGNDVFAGVGTAATAAPGIAIAQASGTDKATAGDVYEVCGFGVSATPANDLVMDGNPAHVHWSGNYSVATTPTPIGGLTVGTTTVASGVNGRILYDNAGLLGEYVTGTGISTWLGTPSSANLRAALTDETGNGLAYFQGGDIGTPSAGVATNLTGTAAGLTAGSFSAGSATNLTSGTLPASRTNGHMNGTATNDNAAAGEIGEFFNAYGTNTSATVTISNASPGIVTQAAHGFKAASPVNFTTTGGLPTGITVGTNYWVCSGATLLAGSYAVATSVDNAIAGTCVATSSAGSGVHTAIGNVIITSLNPFNITGISLTAGDWDIAADTANAPAGTTTISLVSGNISTTSATLAPLANTGSGQMRIDGWGALSTAAGQPPPIFMVGPTRISLASTTTIYLVTLSQFATSTNAAYGFIRARRTR